MGKQRGQARGEVGVAVDTVGGEVVSIGVELKKGVGGKPARRRVRRQTKR